MNPLLSISPIDGRYRNHVEELAEYSSEFGIIKYRTEIEIKYLIALAKTGAIRKLHKEELHLLNKIIEDFDLKDAEKQKEIAQEYAKPTSKPSQGTKHDVKAIEYYLKDKLSKSSLSDVLEYLHFGLTTWDINNISERTMLRDALQKVILTNLEYLNNELLKQAKEYKNLPMLGRTHGQAAIPTTLGKELLIFSERLSKEIKILRSAKFYGKLNGAIGNYNALYLAYPKINWEKFSKEFLSSFGLGINNTTNQIAPYEDIIFVFQAIQRVNGILLDLNQDMWRYISDGWFIQENLEEEIGSSTMPQKINPIMFENSEGNLVIANSLIEGFVNKLPISRLQRDLSGSTIVRNFGMSLAYCLLAYKNSLSGLKKIKANEEKILEDLNSDWSILAEAVQIILRREHVKNSYEIVKSLTRGKKMSKEDYLNFVEDLPTPQKIKEELKKITPENYLGKI